ncbi:protein-tyrosine phosphatase [Cytobacillus eiseniae]|uniref:Protein-tyrosine phosphatase n=1 Tax=Cytobacillus eiseniae TaxID=762947 RepID=A0ABS4RL37_9BACI|nr:low molecular weight protein arginine phosphatase [Cytobacillus eiseniae]MBP2243014.1 protein-tyrosine phosphatase [Cytobacillus eiseniae]
MTRVLFVCTGNTCRSPMAEAILKNHLPNVEVKSAGVYAMDGSAASENTIKVLAEEGILFNQHQSAMMNEQLVNWTSYILTMTLSHKAAVLSMYPAAAGKTYTLKEFAGESGNPDIMDPFGGPLMSYRDTYKELNEMIRKITPILQKDYKGDHNGGETEL